MYPPDPSDFVPDHECKTRDLETARSLIISPRQIRQEFYIGCKNSVATLLLLETSAVAIGLISLRTTEFS